MTITIGNSQGIPMGKYTPSTGGGGGGGGGGTVSVAEKYGVQGDYATHYGILDCPNGLITYSLGKDIIIEPGIVLQAAGSDTKTTIASAINYTIVEDTDVTLFYAEGTILEAGAVYYQTEEPTDGDVGYLAWFNPEIMQWQFKSDDTGNVWRTAVATPIANVRIVDGNITRLDYMGYRILDDDIIAHKQDVDELEALLDEKQNVFATSLPLSYETFEKTGTAYFKSNGAEISDWGSINTQTACLLATYDASNPGNMPGFDRSKSWSVIAKEMYVSTSTSHSSAQYVLELRPYNGVTYIYRPAGTTGAVRFSTNIGGGSSNDVSLPSGYYDFKLEYNGVDYITLSYKATVSEDWIIVASSTYGIPPYPQNTSDYTYCRVGSEAASFSLKNITFINDGIRLFAATENQVLGLKYDNQTIQVNSEGELVANLDELGNEVNAISGRVTALENNDPKASIINEVTSGVIGKAYNSNEDEIVITEPITNRAYLYAPYQAKAFSQNDAIEVTGRTTITSAETVAMPLVVQVISDSKMYLNHSIRTLMNNGVITFGLSVSNYTPATTVTVQVGDVIDFKYIYDPSNSLCELLYDINGSGEFISLGRVAAETTGRDTTLTDRSLLEIWVDGASTIPADYTVKINGNLVFSGNWVEPFIDNKANTDLSNLNSEGKNYIATAVKPSGQYEDLTLLASGSSYTAPGTGYVNLWRICNGSGSYAGLYGAFPSIYSGDANEEFSIFLPVLQGQTFYVFYSDLKTDQPNDAFKFYYDIGASNL